MIAALSPSAHAATNRANLAASRLVVTPTTVQAGARFVATLTVVNRGSLKARGTKTFFMLSKDDRRSGDDVRLGSVATAELKVLKYKSARYSGTIPSSTAGGKQYILGCADGTRTVREKNERDNCKSIAITVTIPIPIDTDRDGIADGADNCAFVSNRSQLDDDNDGKGNACDECPNTANPGAAYCPATVYQVKNGIFPKGMEVQISNLVVTAVSGNRAWAQDAATGTAPGANYGAIQLHYPGAAGLAIGNHINVAGTLGAGVYSYYWMDVVSTTSLGANVSVPAPRVLTAGNLSDQSPAFDSLLVQVAYPSYVGPYNVTSWLMQDPGQFVVLDTLIGTLPALPPSQMYYDITGIRDHDGTYGTVSPRFASDIGPPFSV